MVYRVDPHLKTVFPLFPAFSIFDSESHDAFFILYKFHAPVQYPDVSLLIKQFALYYLALLDSLGVFSLQKEKLMLRPAP